MLGWFRDNQHRMLVFFTVLLMAGFGVMGVISSSSSSNRSSAVAPEAKPVKSWKFGNVTDADLWKIRRQRVALQTLQMELMTEAQKYQANYRPQSGLLFGNLVPSESTEDEIFSESFRIKLLAQKAEDMGMVVSEATADAYFSRFVDQWVPMDQIQAIANEVGAQDRFSYTDFREIAKREILASYAAVVCVGGGKPAMPSPTQAFQYYKRIEQKIECQVLAMPVEDFKSKVTGTPSDAEIKELYEEGKYYFPAYDYSRPGFKIENRLKLQYLQAELNTFTEKYKADLSDELIQREYDRLVKEKAPLVYEAQLSPVAPLDLIPGGSQENTEGSPESGDDGNADGLPKLPGSGAEIIDGGAPVTEPKLEEPAAETPSTPATEPASDKPPVPTTDPKTGDPKTGDQTSANAQSRVYVTTQDESTTATDAAQAEQETKTEAVDTAETQENQAGVTSTTAGSEDKDQTETKDQGKIRPLEEVREEIKTRLAQPKAFEEMDRIFGELKKEMIIYRTDLRLHEASPDTEPAPKPMDYEAMAKQYGLTYMETGVLDYKTMSEQPIGRAGAQRGMPLADMLFRNFEQVKKFAPETPNDSVLVWVAEKYPAKIPSLDEARESIIDYWKQQKAIELALNAAKEKADTVAASGKLMREVDDKASLAGSFSWYTNNPYQGYAQISAVPNVDQPGEDFMAAAFGLKVNGAAAALNDNRTVAYVIQKTADAGLTEAELRENFLKSTEQFAGYPVQVPTIAQNRAARATSQFLKNLQEEYDCKDLQ